MKRIRSRRLVLPFSVSSLHADKRTALMNPWGRTMSVHFLAAAVCLQLFGCGGSDSGTKPDDGGNGDGTDTLPPYVVMTAPASGSTINGAVTMTAEATDSSGVRMVYFRVSDFCGNLYFDLADSIPPYEGQWSPDDSQIGEFHLCASAIDSAGNHSDWVCVNAKHGTSGVSIGQFVPPGMHVGGEVAVYGSGFGPDDGTGMVMFHDKEAQVVSWSENSITFIVPTGVMQDAMTDVTVVVDCRLTASKLFDVTPQGVVRLTDDPGNDGEPCWSYDGGRIYFSSMRSGNYDIWSIPATGGGALQFTYDPANDNWPDSNPNADVLAWGSRGLNGSWNPEGDYEIFTGTLSTLAQITVDTLIDRTPAWSPTNYMGYLLAYSNYEEDAYHTLLPQITLYSQTDGHVYFADGENPNFSPNGRIVVYSLEANIYTKTIGASDEPVQLTNADHDGAPHWGWANDKIVFERFGGYTGSDIYIMDPNGTNQTPLIATMSYEYSPTWSPDCTKVVYAAFRYSNLDIYVFSVTP